MLGCLSARLGPDEEGLPLPYDSNMHQRRRRSRAGQLKLIHSAFGRILACLYYLSSSEGEESGAFSSLRGWSI